MPAEAAPPADDTAAALTRLAREESGRVLALLARRFGDLDLADEAVQDALTEAARTWGPRGVPANPPGWLLAVARRKAIDRLRRTSSAWRRTMAAAPELAADAMSAAGDGGAAPSHRRPLLVDDDPGDNPVDDDRLRLMLLCCHPALGREAQTALTLRLVGGLSVPEIAAAFLLSEATLAQRIVRAKRKIRDAGIPLRIPADLDTRIEVVLSVLYLVFNEGYLSRGHSGDVVRVDLVDEAVRLTELLGELVPDHPEVLGLLALQRFHRARLATRTDAAGELVLLEDQDRARWDRAEIAAANAVLHRAISRMRPGPYQLQAVIAGYHANAPSAAATDWPAIAAAYRQLVAMTGSPVVQVNHAVAVAMVDGAEAGLAVLDALAGVDGYHLFHAARAELLARAGRPAEAAAAFTRARALTDNPAEQRHLARRRQEAEQPPAPGPGAGRRVTPSGSS
ncbi:MAG: DUF6596 domain-containing protein [Acidimicrobiales bacterium]